MSTDAPIIDQVPGGEDETTVVLPPRRSDDVRSTPSAPPAPRLNVWFKNSYTANVKVAIMRYDPSACGGEHGDWATAGWWRLEPGQQVLAFKTNNRYIGFYAKAEDDALWDGPYGPVVVYPDDWQSCIGIVPEDPSETVGMRLVDIGPSGMVINLTQG